MEVIPQFPGAGFADHGSAEVPAKDFFLWIEGIGQTIEAAFEEAAEGSPAIGDEGGVNRR